jgi:HlyD family secretion protein
VRYGSTTTDGVVTYTTVLKVNNDSLELRPGMTATAVITTRKLENALLVPSAALRFAPPQATAAAEGEKSGGSLINSILPHPPHRDHEKKTKSPSRRTSGRRCTCFGTDSSERCPLPPASQTEPIRR